MSSARVIVDSNVLISRLLIPQSVAARAVNRAMAHAQLLASEATLTELADVLSRSKFDPYVSLEDRQEFFRRFAQVAEIVPIVSTVRDCRDPNDNKFLELAVDGRATLLVTGDSDLLTLSPFRGIEIVTPATFMGVKWKAESE
jgi:putative PIN family toxin of toxin-antitoxin system